MGMAHPLHGVGARLSIDAVRRCDRRAHRAGRPPLRPSLAPAGHGPPGGLAGTLPGDEQPRRRPRLAARQSRAVGLGLARSHAVGRRPGGRPPARDHRSAPTAVVDGIRSAASLVEHAPPTDARDRPVGMKTLLLGIVRSPAERTRLGRLETTDGHPRVLLFEDRLEADMLDPGFVGRLAAPQRMVYRRLPWWAA